MECTKCGYHCPDDRALFCPLCGKGYSFRMIKQTVKQAALPLIAPMPQKNEVFQMLRFAAVNTSP